MSSTSDALRDGWEGTEWRAAAAQQAPPSDSAAREPNETLQVRGPAKNAVWTLAMAVVASAICEVAAVAKLGMPPESVSKPLWLGAVILVLFLLLPRWPWAQRLGRGRTGEALLVLVAIAPFLAKWLTAPHHFLGYLPYLMLTSVRNVALVAAIFGRRARMRYLVASCSLFLALFSYAAAPGTVAMLLLLVYVCLGIIWLMSEYWSRLAAMPLAGQTAELPLAPTVVACLSAVLLAAVAVLYYPDEISLFGRLMAQWTGGQGDARNVRRMSDLINEEQEAIGTMATRKYGAAQGGAGSAQRANAENAKQEEARRFIHRPRDFSVVRSGGGTLGEGKKSAFQIEGPAGVRMPVTTYGLFDGRNWQADVPELARRPTAQITKDGSWMTLLQRPEFFLNQDPNPSTSNPESADSLNDDLVGLARAIAQRLTSRAVAKDRVVDSFVRELDPERLAQMLSSDLAQSDRLAYLLTDEEYGSLQELIRKNPAAVQPASRFARNAKDEIAALIQQWARGSLAKKQTASQGLSPEFAALVKRWTAGKRKGWEEIDAIVQGIRGQAEHDPAAALADVDDPIAEFLIKSRRGPDYAFATAAVQALRSLGYPSRMVGGFYASPQAHQWYSNRTTVASEDVHFWPQVLLPGQVWTDLEPTPGYELARPPRSWSQFLQQRWEAALAWMRDYGITTGLMTVILLFAFLARQRIADVAATWLWRWQGRGAARKAVPATWRLLERRAWLAGRRRSPGQTLERWLRSLSAPAMGELQVLVRAQDRLTHAPGDSQAAGPSDVEIALACRAAARCCTVGWFREHPTPPSALSAASAVPPAVRLRRRADGPMRGLRPARYERAPRAANPPADAA